MRYGIVSKITDNQRPQKNNREKITTTAFDNDQNVYLLIIYKRPCDDKIFKREKQRYVLTERLSIDTNCCSQSVVYIYTMQIY